MCTMFVTGGRRRVRIVAVLPACMIVVVMIAVVLIFGLVTVDPPSILLLASLAYAVSGPVMSVVKGRR